MFLHLCSSLVLSKFNYAAEAMLNFFYNKTKKLDTRTVFKFNSKLNYAAVAMLNFFFIKKNNNNYLYQ